MFNLSFKKTFGFVDKIIRIKNKAKSETTNREMSLSKPKWLAVISVLGTVGTASVLAWLIYQRRRQSREKEAENKLRKMIENQLCFGRPGSTTILVNNLDDWNEIEDRFLRKIDETRIMGLDCEWVSDGKSTGKVMRDCFYIIV